MWKEGSYGCIDSNWNGVIDWEVGYQGGGEKVLVVCLV